MTEPLDAVSFTAARDLDEAGAGVIVNVLCQVPPARRYLTGGAMPRLDPATGTVAYPLLDRCMDVIREARD